MISYSRPADRAGANRRQKSAHRGVGRRNPLTAERGSLKVGAENRIQWPD